jgi:hypothetical protein
VERKATPEPAVKLGIRLHLTGVQLSNTISDLENLGVGRCRSTVHNWTQKADLQPTAGADLAPMGLIRTFQPSDDALGTDFRSEFTEKLRGLMRSQEK